MQKGYDSYDWVTLYRNDNLRKLTGQVLDKYINHHHLRKCRIASEKLALVKEHIQDTLLGAQAQGEASCACQVIQAQGEASCFQSGDSSESEYENDSGEDDLVLANCDSTEEGSSNSSSDGDNSSDTHMTQEPAPLNTFFDLDEFQTGRGRNVRPPSHFKYCL